jgi:peptidyl-dipeptidase Dcp
MNPLLQQSTLRHGAIPYDQIRGEHFLPGIQEAIRIGKENLDKVKSHPASFENTIEGIEFADDYVGYVSNIFFGLYSAHCTEDIEKISEEFNSILTKYYNSISLDADLFLKVKEAKENTNLENLNDEQKTLLDKMYKSFVRNGAELSEDDKNIIRSIDEEMSALEVKFTENVRKATNDYQLVVEDKVDINGIPDNAVEAAATLAAEKGFDGKWMFTLHFPSYLPFMQNCKNSKLRKKMSKARQTVAFGGEFDNTNSVLRMLKLKQQRANLLGYKTHADFILEERMAKDPKTVTDFLENIKSKAKPASLMEVKELKELKKELDGNENLHSWDLSFYTQILKKKKLDIDDEVLRPYLKLENVIDGVFKIAENLFDIEFKQVSDLPTWHEDVKTFEVFNKDSSFIGLFYCDFHPREEKRPGAWMSDTVAQGMMFGKIGTPQIHNTCNFTKPTKSKPSLLTLNEVETLFHEFGHGLHGLLSKCHYKSIAGTNVLWDFVELPSQIMENWVKEKECLDLFAIHFETGEKIPADIIEKIKKSATFQEGYATMRQVSLATLDMKLHTTDPKEITDLAAFEKDVLSEFKFTDDDGFDISMLASFGHIFPHGGYSSGYYSYKWAEVLDADAFEAFKEKSIFDKDVAKKFRENILEKGGSIHPMELYKAFRGKEPSVDPLLRRAGLL